MMMKSLVWLWFYFSAPDQPHTESDNERSGGAEDSLQYYSDDEELDLQLSSPNVVQLAVDKSVFKLYILHVLLYSIEVNQHVYIH